jgi:hypothetical protein
MDSAELFLSHSIPTDSLQQKELYPVDDPFQRVEWQEEARLEGADEDCESLGRKTSSFFPTRKRGCLSEK